MVPGACKLMPLPAVERGSPQPAKSGRFFAVSKTTLPANPAPRPGTHPASYHQAGGKLRKILIIGLLVAAATPSHAAKRLNVSQLAKLVSTEMAAHKQDAEIAKQIKNVVLTQQFPHAQLAQLLIHLDPGPQSSQALKLLADQSEFLESSADESTAQAIPNSTEQARMLDSAREYVSETLLRLPNFLATRIISRFDDTPVADKPGDWPTRTGLHLVTNMREPTSVRIDKEDQPAAQGSAAWGPATGLVSGGEFGTTLGMVLADMSKGEVSWSHWERTSAGVLAVFHFSVPATASHFVVYSAFRPEAPTEAVRSTPNVRGISGVTLQQDLGSGNLQLVREKPAYAGAIWLDPANGVVYRVTMETDTKLGLHVLRSAAILVEYGPVRIAGKTYICPLRSLAKAVAVTTTESRLGNAPTEWLNETVFADYHRFGSTVRIMGEEAKGTAGEAAPSGEEAAAASSGESAAQNTNAGATAQTAEENAPPLTQPQAHSVPPPVSAAASKAGDEAIKKSQVATEASSAPATAEKAAMAPAELAPLKPEDSGAVLRVNVDSLLVPAVVLDKNGEAVRDLSKSDFVVMDDGKPREISGFTLVKNAPSAGASGANGGTQNASSGITGGAAGPETEPSRNRYVVFLFDDRHLDVNDLQLVKKAASKLFDQPLAEGEYADVLSLSGVNSGITREHSALQAAVTKLTFHQAVHGTKENCPNVDYYEADQIINHHNVEDFQRAVANARQCTMVQVPNTSSPDEGLNNPTDPFQHAAMQAARNALALGDEDARESLLTVLNVVRAMGKLPGQRVLVLVSPGFLALTDETRELESEIMNTAAASNVTVNALDARGLAGPGFDASQGGTSLGVVTGQMVQEHLVSMQVRANVMSELAEGTGGRYFHDNNDLQGGLASLAAAPEDLYLLEISLKDVKANGAYHRLRVKVDRPGLEVLSRKGYTAPKKAKRK